MTNWTISSNGKYLLIESTDGNYWELEKNQITFKKANELVLIDRNGMHLVGIDYRRINGGYGSTDLAIEALKAMVADAAFGVTGNLTIDTTGLATSANQTNGDQKTQITDGAGVVNTKQLGTQLTTNDVGLVANTTIHGLSSSGGGTFVDVKVNPAGKLEVNDADTQTKLSNGSQKTQIVDSNGNSLGTPTNPISVDANLNVETEGLSTFQQQYNQTDLLNMILEELQQQTKILKKIYQ